MIRRTFLLIGLALSLLTLPIQSQERTPSHQHQHADGCTVVQVAQGRYYIAVCSQKDLYQRFNDRSAAYRAAQDHARKTGHSTSVIVQ